MRAAPVFNIETDLNRLVDARKAAAAEREALLKGHRNAMHVSSTDHLDRQISEFDQQMATMILHRAFERPSMEPHSREA
jgi:hypothetical protein